MKLFFQKPTKQQYARDIQASTPGHTHFQAKDVDTFIFFLGKIWHVTIIPLLIFEPGILNCLESFVFKRLDRWCLLRETRAWGPLNTSEDGEEKVHSSTRGYNDTHTQKARGERGKGRWDGWMASPTGWTWVWATWGRQWWTEKPGELQSMGVPRSWTRLNNEQQKMQLRPSAPSENEEQDRRQRRGLSPAKPIHGFQGLEWEW